MKGAKRVVKPNPHDRTLPNLLPSNGSLLLNYSRHPDRSPRAVAADLEQIHLDCGRAAEIGSR
jgi:hypothetical protein